MKLLLTSGGITNPTIDEALVGLLGKSIAESNALFIPTAQYGQPACTPASVWRSIAGHGMCDLGW
ncbi:MAG TPA: peptidase E, partial [Micropruina sp.]|nr:peptidase E [Micropruina sp.]HMR21567.1 peptidase E [Micropruina sp.]